MLVVDSSVWIDYFNGRLSPQTDYLDRILEDIPILVGDLILAEVLQGFQNGEDFENAMLAFSQFTQAGMVGPRFALQSARNYRYLRQKGFTVRKTINSLIATFCIEHHHILLHNDNDFAPFEKHLGLQTIHP